MAVQLRGRLARLIGVPLLLIGLLQCGGNLVAIAVERAFSPRYAVAGPLFMVLGAAMVVFPGRGPIESNTGGPPGAFERMLRGLGRREILAWGIATALGIVLGVAWRFGIQTVE
jgi:hypothetical protein